MDKNKLIELLMQEKGGTREQYLSLLNSIAYHESAGTLDPKLKQYGGGPGRGKYQYEVGRDEGGITAARRAKNLLDTKGLPTPEWLDETLQGDSLDVSTLTSDQQDFLFLADKRMHPKADFAKYISGEESVEDFWANYHWSGSPDKRDERIASFKTSLEGYGKLEDTVKKSTSPTPSAFSNAPVANTEVDNTRVAQPQVDKIGVQPQQESQSYAGLFDHLKNKQGGQFNEINEGGTHEENPLGGVPQGIGANGKVNTVEEGETSFNFGDDKFIFSNRVSLTDYVKGKSQPNQFAVGGSLNGECGGEGQPPCPPIHVESKNDPRYTAYQDSLALYNSSEKLFNDHVEIAKEVDKGMSEKYGRKMSADWVKKGNTPFDESREAEYYTEKNEYILKRPSEIKPISYDNYARQMYDGDGTFDEFRGDKVPTTDIPIYKKPKQPVVIQRPQVDVPDSSLNKTRDVNIGLVGKNIEPPVNKAPEVDYWKYQRSTTGFGANTSTGKTYDTDKVHHMLDQQERDELGGRSKNNKLRVEPVYKNSFAFGGKLNGNCGGPGQPPCKDDTDLSKIQILDEVKLSHKKKDPRFVKEDDPRYQSYNDSLGLYKKGLNDLKGGKGYEHLSYYKGKPRGQYPFALSSDNSNSNRERILNEKEISNEISDYGKRDYDYVMSGKAKARYEASKNGDMYDDGEHLHKYQLPYSELSEIRNHYNEMPKLHPDGQRIKPTSIVFGPESDPVALYNKPKGKFFVEGSPEAEVARRQLILKQRGTYDGPIDGVWGDKSEKALENTRFMDTKNAPKFQDLDFGKYSDYFEILNMAGETTVVQNTSKNPHNAETMKQLEKELRKLNPGKKFKIQYKNQNGR